MTTANKMTQPKKAFRQAALCSLAVLALTAGVAQSAAAACQVVESTESYDRIYDFDLETVTVKAYERPYNNPNFGMNTLPMNSLSERAQQKIEQVRQQLPAACKPAPVLKK